MNADDGKCRTILCLRVRDVNGHPAMPSVQKPCSKCKEPTWITFASCSVADERKLNIICTVCLNPQRTITLYMTKEQIEELRPKEAN